MKFEAVYNKVAENTIIEVVSVPSEKKVCNLTIGHFPNIDKLQKTHVERIQAVDNNKIRIYIREEVMM